MPPSSGVPLSSGSACFCGSDGGFGCVSVMRWRIYYWRPILQIYPAPHSRGDCRNNPEKSLQDWAQPFALHGPLGVNSLCLQILEATAGSVGRLRFWAKLARRDGCLLFQLPAFAQGRRRKCNRRLSGYSADAVSGLRQAALTLHSLAGAGGLADLGLNYRAPTSADRPTRQHTIGSARS